MRPDQIPTELPAHPQEGRLRKGEDQLADALEQLAAKTVVALRTHDRHAAVVLLAQLAQTAAQWQELYQADLPDQPPHVRVGEQCGFCGGCWPCPPVDRPLWWRQGECDE